MVGSIKKQKIPVSFRAIRAMLSAVSSAFTSEEVREPGKVNSD